MCKVISQVLTVATNLGMGHHQSAKLAVHANSHLAVHWATAVMVFGCKVEHLGLHPETVLRINIGNTYDMNQDNQDPAVVKERVKWIYEQGRTTSPSGAC